MIAKFKNAFEQLCFNKSKFRILTEFGIFILFFLMFFITMTFNYIQPWNYINIVIYIVLSIAIIVWALLYKRIVIDYFFVLLVIFNFLITVSSLINGIIYFDMTVFSLTITCFIFYQFVRYKEHRNIILHLFAVAGIFFILIFIAKYYQDLLNFDGSRIGSDFGDLNIVGYIFLYIFCCYMYLGLIKRRWWYLLPAVASIVLIFVTGSRSALIIGAIVLATTIFLFFGRKKIYYSLLILSTLIGLIVIILSLPIFESLRDRLLNSVEVLFSMGIINSNEPRMFLFLEGIEFSLKRPIFGYGGTLLFQEYSFSGHFAHNNIMELWFNYGFFEMLLFQAIIFIPLFKIFKKRDYEKKMMLLFLISIFLIQFFYSNYTVKIDYLVLTLIYGYANEGDNLSEAWSISSNLEDENELKKQTFTNRVKIYLNEGETN